MAHPKSDFDSPWKEILDRYFKDFMAFFPVHSGKLWGSHARLEFPVAKLMDYADKWDALDQTKNPFGVFVMAHLKALETRHDFESRLNWKLNIAKRLYGQGFGRQDIIELFRFIDWVMVLPEGLENIFSEQLMKYEEEKKMPYIASKKSVSRRVSRKVSTYPSGNCC